VFGERRGSGVAKAGNKVQGATKQIFQIKGHFWTQVILNFSQNKKFNKQIFPLQFIISVLLLLPGAELSLVEILTFSTTSFHFPRSWTQAVQFYNFC
jgi:hypothetical protein